MYHLNKKAITLNQATSKTTLQRKFAGLVLFNSILVTILLIVLFGFWRYYQIVDNHKQQIESLTPEHLSGIENSLWLMDNLQTRRQLNELRLILDIDYAEVEADGEKIAAVGSSISNPLLSRSIEIKRTEGNKVYQLGTLKLFIDGHSITSDLLDELLPILAITLLAVIIPGILINSSMKKIVSNRLENIVALLNQPDNSVDLKQTLTELISDQNFDEIDRLTEEILQFHNKNINLNTDLKQQQYQHKLVFENMGSLVGLLDNEGKILNINRMAVELSPYDKAELVGTYFWEKLWFPWTLPTKSLPKDLAEASLKGSLVREEISFSSSKGKYYLEISFTPILKDGEVLFVLVEGKDITQMRRWEIQLETQVKLLEYCLTENSALAITQKIVSDIDALLPSGINLHIFQKNTQRNIHEIIAGGLQNPSENTSFQEVVSSLLKTDFSLKGPTIISFENKSLDLSTEIINLTKQLPFSSLYVEPVNDENIPNSKKTYSIITVGNNHRISSYVSQLCSLCTSLVGLAIYREKQQKITQEIEDNLGEVVNSSLDGILVLDETGTIIMANNAFSNLLGEDRREINGKEFWELPVSTSKSETQALINSTRVSGKQRYQITLDNKDGTRYCDLTLITIGEEQPQFYAFFQDRTQQQLLVNELEEQYQFINAVLKSTSDAILACDANGKITLYSNRVHELLTPPSDEINDEDWSDLYQLYAEDGVTELAKEQYPLYIALTEGKIENISITAKSHTGTTRKLVCNGARLYSSKGEIIGAVVSAHDITFEQVARLELEQLVETRTEDLQQANDELEAFAYSVSHDLRAPLRSINGFAEILHEDYSGLISISGQDLLQRIMNNATYLGSLIEDLLELSKISRTTIEANEVDISIICEELLHEEKHNLAKLQFTVEKNLIIYGDQGLIKILMKNLISNAVKYSSKSSAPTVQFYADCSENKTKFILEDNGVGFDTKFSGKIFKPFQRVHGDEYEGTGIGLSIVHRIIKRHQGDIKISSEVNKGTLVNFNFSEK